MFTAVIAASCLDWAGSEVPWLVQLQPSASGPVVELRGPGGAETRVLSGSLSGAARTLLQLHMAGRAGIQWLENDPAVGRGRGMLVFDFSSESGALLGFSARYGQVRGFLGSTAPYPQEDGGFFWCIALQGLSALEAARKAAMLFPWSGAATATIEGVELMRARAAWDVLLAETEVQALECRDGEVRLAGLSPQSIRSTAARYWRRFQGDTNFALCAAGLAVAGASLSQRDSQLAAVVATFPVQDPLGLLDSFQRACASGALNISPGA